MAAVVSNGARSPSNNDDENDVTANNDTAVKSAADTPSDLANATRESSKTTDDGCSTNVTSATTTRISRPLNLSQTNDDDAKTSKKSSKPKSSLTCGYSVESILGHKYGGAKSARQQPSSTGLLSFRLNLSAQQRLLGRF